MRIDRHTAGVYVITATPFSPDGAIDWPSIDRLIDFYVAAGAGSTASPALGLMDEADKLTPDERRAVLARILGRTCLPVVVGVSDSGLDNLHDFAHHAMDTGTAGVVVAPARGTLREDRGIGYFRQVCEALGPEVPVVYQDFPQTTGMPCRSRRTASLMLTRDLPQIVMLKHEDSPGLAKIRAIRAAEAKRFAASIYPVRKWRPAPAAEGLARRGRAR